MRQSLSLTTVSFYWNNGLLLASGMDSVPQLLKYWKLTNKGDNMVNFQGACPKSIWAVKPAHATISKSVNILQYFCCNASLLFNLIFA